MIDTRTVCRPGGATSRTRTRFFPGLLLGSDDLTQEQNYFIEKHRRHNRMLHGWGIVCGVRVRQGNQPCQVVVEPGYVLGPYGDEIMIDAETVVDLCHEDLDGNAVGPCGDALDPWCSNIQVDRRAGQTLYIAVRYEECSTRPVRSAVGACGCDVSDCEYSRIRDSFAIKVLSRLPSTYDPMPPTNLQHVAGCDGTNLRPCPPCPSEPWVILADITMNAQQEIQEIDCFTHRRYVASYGDYYFLCQQVAGGGFTPAGSLINRAHLAALALGRPTLLDLSAAENETPETRIPVRTTAGDWISFPVHFAVQPGETFASLLDREGDREYYDPDADQIYTLREIFALTSVNPADTVESVGEATLPLQGVRLSVPDLRVVSAGISELLDSSGIDRWRSEHGGFVESATELPATALAGISPRSNLGQQLRGRTVADIAGQDQQAFVDMALENVSDRQRTTETRRAREIWLNARRISSLVEEWKTT